MADFSSFQTGQQVNFTRLFEFNDVKRFAELTGDNNPIHVNPDFAAETHFKRCIVHGTYVVSVVGTILGTIFPGNGTILVSEQYLFKNPAYVGETVIINLEIKSLHTEKKMIGLTVRCTNSLGEILVQGEVLTKKIY